MKKTGKLAVLLLVVAMLCTVFAVTSSADYATRVLVDTDCKSGGSESGIIHTNEADGNSYLSYRYVKSPDVYDFGSSVSGVFNGDWAYLTLDYDLMTETTYEGGNGTRMYVMTRNAGSNPLGMSMLKVAANPDGSAKLTAEKTGETYEIPSESFSWLHITNVLMFNHEKSASNEVKNDQSVLLTFVNGELIFRQVGVVAGDSLSINGFRLQSAAKAESDATVCVDNVKMVLIGKDYDGNLTKLFDGGEHTLDEADYDVAYNKSYELPFGKKRAGVFNLAGYETVYDRMQSAFDAVRDGYEIKLYDDVTNVNITNEITVDANRHEFSWISDNLAVTTAERNGSTVYTFRRTDRFAYFTFYPEGPGSEPDGVDIPIPIGATPVYTGDRLKTVIDDETGYFVFGGWYVFGETPVTAVTAGDVDSYFDLYPVYQEKKAPTTGNISYRNDCENGTLTLGNGSSETFAGSGLVKAAGNSYYRYFAVLNAVGDSNPGGTSAFIMMSYGNLKLSDYSYFVMEFDISTEDIPATGIFQPTGRNSAGSPMSATQLTVTNKDGKMVLSLGSGSVTLDPGEWAHVTLIVQSRGDTSADASATMFVNGERVSTLDKFWSSSAVLRLDDLRFVPSKSNPAGATLCLDNVVLQTFDKTYKGGLSNLFGNTTTDLNQKMYRDVMWSTDYELPSVTAAARADGVDYVSIEAALKAVSEGGTLELLRDLSGEIVIDRPMTIITNGFAFSYKAPGYDVATPSDGVYVFSETTKIAYYTFYNLDGSVLIADAPVVYGMVPAPGVAFSTAWETESGALRMFSSWMCDGKPLTAVTEAELDGHFDVYPEYTEITDYSALIYDKDGNLSVVRRESEIASALTSAAAGSTFIFNCDYYVTATIKINGLYIDLNGHTVSSNGDPNVAKYSPFWIAGESYLYSSKKGGYLRITPVVKDGVEQSYAAKDSGTPATFVLDKNITMGTVYNPVLKKTYDGDNFTWSGGALINTWTATFTIDGGHYFSHLGDFSATFISRGTLKNHQISNAEIYTTRMLFSFQQANGTEIHVDNCRIYFTSNSIDLVTATAGATNADPSGTLYLTNTSVFRGRVNVAGGTGCLVVGEGCAFSTLGTTRTTIASGLILASKETTFVSSEELTKFLGREVTVTATSFLTSGDDLITVVWQDGTIDKWLAGTLPTHTTADGKVVVDGWLCTPDGTWIFRDADGNLLTFDVLPDSLKGKTIYAEAGGLTREKEVYVTLSYGGKTEYFYAAELKTVGARLMELGKSAANGAITVTFHRDISGVKTDGFYTGSADNVVPFYFDLNGHSVEVTSYFLSVKGSTGYYIYSSKPGAVIRTDGNLAYNYSRGGSTVYVGEVTTTDGITHDGDNLTVHAARLYNNGTYSGTYTYNYRIKGGAYYITGTMFAMDAYANLNVTFENAAFYVPGSGLLNIQSGRTANFTATGCTFLLGASTTFIGAGAGTGTITLTDTAVYGAAVGRKGSYTLTLSGNIRLSHMPLSEVTVSGNLCLAHAPETEVTYEGADGKTYTYRQAYRIASLSDVLKVEWKNGDMTETDYWLPGTRLACLIDLVPTLDPDDDRYALVPNGTWTFLLNGGLLSDPTVEDYMAGGTVTATPSLDRISLSFYVILANGDLVTYTATDYNTFRNAVQALPEGARLVMHTDYADIPNATIYIQSNNVEIDLNGHFITTPTKTSGSVFWLRTGNTAYIYSSAPGASMCASSGGFTLLCEKTSTMYVGVTKDGTTFDRENLLLYGTSAIQINGNAVFKNITYINTKPDNAGLFQFQDNDTTLLIDGCYLVNTGYTALVAGRLGDRFTATINNSVIYLWRSKAEDANGLTGMDSRCSGTGTLTMTNTLVHCKNMVASAKLPVTVGEGCRFITDGKVDNISLASELVFARVATETIDLTILGNTYTLTLSYEVVASGNTATVGWMQANGDTKDEVWKKGEIPTYDEEIATSDKYVSWIYRCETPLTGDIVVEPTLSLRLPLKENLTLSENFTYNLYIPADAAIVKRVTVNGTEVTLDKTRTIDGVLYYVVSCTGITPRDAMKDVSVVIYTETSSGRTFEKNVTLSVCGYAEKLLAGTPSAEAEQMVVDMLAYIRAVHCYFTSAAERDTARVDALLEGRTPSTPVYGTAPDLGDLAKVLFGASLSLDGTPSFAFRVRDDFKGTLTISYTDNAGKVVSHDFDFTTGGNMYVFCALPMTEMRKTLTLTAKDAEGTTVATGSYNLDAYILGISGDLVPEFAARLYAYATSCEAYVKSLS